MSNNSALKANSVPEDDDLLTVGEENVLPEKGSLLSQCIRSRRASLGWTVVDLAKKAQVGRSTIWAIERDRYNVRIDMLEKVIKALEIRLYAMDENGEFNHLAL